MIPEATTTALVTKAAESSIGPLVRPLVTGALSGIRSISVPILDLFVDRFSEYIRREVLRHSYLNTIVFGNQKPLEDLYVPLTVIPMGSETRPPEHILLSRFRMEFLPKVKRALVTDTAGMGKSTLLKFLFLQCVKSNYAVPIFVELRHLSRTQLIVDLVMRQLNPGVEKDAESYFNRHRVDRIFRKGGLVFFLDGYDEIPFKDRERVTRDVKGFIDKYPNNLYAIASRPETGLFALPQFKSFSIRPLKREESFELIRKYDENGDRSKQLIAKLQGRDFRAVQDFLRNPLLTSLLYRSFEYKQNLPIKKHVFYRQVFDALFDWHDATKDGYNTREKKSKLDIDGFHRVLRVLGFISTIQGKLEGEADTILEWIRQARGVCVGVNFYESDFLEDLIKAVPIFVKDGLYYRWSHKSLAEYFAAQYICTEGKEHQEKILGELLDSGKLDRFSNMIDQVYDIDIAAFRKCLILPMAREFKKYWATAYRDTDPRIPSELVELRKSCAFGGMFLLGGKNHMGNWDAIERTLEPFGRKLWGAARTIPDAPIQIRFPERLESTVDFYAILPGRFSAILDVLEAKKDELVRSRSLIDLGKYKSRLRVRPLKRWLEVTDDRKNAVNSASNFGPTTALLIRNGATVLNANRLLNFEESLVESSRLSSLTTQLLKTLKATDAPK